MSIFRILMEFSGYLCPLSKRRIQDEPRLARRHEMAARRYRPLLFACVCRLCYRAQKVGTIDASISNKNTATVGGIAIDFSIDGANNVGLNDEAGHAKAFAKDSKTLLE